ncbi:unnamed protein product [Trifolium pratense]|uniref:Uncharacterized protein n=1 Tax=Trifolium pratense TaxID=57577 RepID=A0ACB0IYS7_TRIPR|nr:unnamed protein product [Trifolium pratense]
MVGELKPFILCIQETKLQNCDTFLSSTLWGSTSHGFSYRPSAGASGGLLTLWDSSEVEVWSTESREHVLWCHGRFLKTGEEFYVANVYAPCDDGAKQGLWESLSARLLLLAGKRVCVCGDFNAVKHIDERRSVRGGNRSSDHIPFNQFIEDNMLIDLPLIGRKFTWFKGDGHSMSRLDRFLLSEEWCLNWPNCKQMAKMRGLSDHCPLVLSANEEDWRPRPSRMLKCWKDIPGYKLFVRDKWNSFQVDGWGGYVIKEKLKMIKVALKDWHKTHAQNLPSRIDNLKIRLSALDEKGGEDDLSEEEFVELHGVSNEIHSLSRLHASISWQQSRSLWLKEGDANSKYFHSVLASRRRRNSLAVIQVDGVTVEGVNPIRQAVFSHFESHFQAPIVDRPGIDDLQFKRKWIRECVCTATASVLVNGSPTDEFPLRRGLRQGDPLSPFLFLLAAEGLNVLMEAMVARNLFTGYSIGGQGSVSVSHLQFADDTLLMGIKSWANVRALRAVLVLFETMSGLKVNFNKSMLVGVNISESWLCEAASTLWKSVCLRKEYGGLGVRQLREFNIALLGKWCWRMLVDREGLWFRVLVARYGLEGGSLRAGGQRGSVWWRELVRIREGVGEPGGSWFSEHVSRRVGDGSDTLFWTDPWLDGISLRERFGRLFELAVTKSHSVAEMFALGWGADGGAWEWRRRLWAWEEEMLGECQTLLLDISLQDQVIDRWHWRLDPDSGYTVPLKVSIFAWRLLRDRLPTRANLVSRGVLPPTAATCVFGCGSAESAHHLFLSCSIAGSLWDLVRAWIGISLVDSTSLRDHFVQFTASSGGSRARRSFLQLVWLACVWVLWTERNHRLWLKTTNITLALNYHSWWSSPLLCLGLV